MKNLKNKKLISRAAFLILVFIIFGLASEIANAGGGTPTINQRHYRWRNDDGSEAAATWKAAENTAVTGQAKEANVRLRFEIDNTGTASLGNQDYNGSWYYSTDAGGDCSAGTWTLIPVTPTTEHWELVSSTNFADKDATTDNGFSTHTNTTFLAGKMREEPVGGGNYNVSLATTDYTHAEEVLQATTNATDGGTYYIRATRAGTVFDNYVQCATITIAAAAAAAPTVTTNAATGVGVSSATLNGEITATGGANATDRGFAFSTDSALVTGVSTTTESGDFGTGAFSQYVSGLLSGTQYFFRAYATNVNGTGYGTILNFTTTTDITPSRKMRLFEGFRIRVIGGRIILHQR